MPQFQVLFFKFDKNLIPYSLASISVGQGCRNLVISDDNANVYVGTSNGFLRSFTRLQRMLVNIFFCMNIFYLVACQVGEIFVSSTRSLSPTVPAPTLSVGPTPSSAPSSSGVPTCALCPANTYSVNPSSLSCVNCFLNITYKPDPSRMLNNSNFDSDTVLAAGPGAFEYRTPSYWQSGGTVALVSSGSSFWGSVVPQSGIQFLALQYGGTYIEQLVYPFSSSSNYNFIFYARNRPFSPGGIANLDVRFFSICLQLSKIFIADFCRWSPNWYCISSVRSLDSVFASVLKNSRNCFCPQVLFFY